MSYHKYLLSGLCISLGLGGSVCADVAPEQVWEKIQSDIKQYTHDITAQSVTREGKALVARDVKIFFTPEGNIFSIGHITLTDQGNGSVLVSFADHSSFMADGDMLTADMVHSAAEMMVTGSPEALSYDYAVPTVSIKGRGKKEPSRLLDIDVTATGIKGQYSSDGRIKESFFGALAWDRISGRIFGEDPAKNTKKLVVEIDVSDVSMKGSIEKIGGKFGIGPLWMQSEGGIEGEFSHGQIKLDSSFEEQDKAESKFHMFQDRGNGKVRIKEGLAIYQLALHDFDMMLASADLPVPEILISFKEISQNVSLSFAQNDVISDYPIVFKIDHLVLGDAIWTFLDKDGRFPHDPININFDAKWTGKSNLGSVGLEPESNMADSSEKLPFIVKHVALNDLLVSGAGLLITGKGDVAVDQSGFIVSGRVPFLTGKFNFTLEGVNEFINHFVEMKLVAPEKILPVRMAIATFFKAVDGKDDHFSSEIAFDGKSITVNGAKIN